MSDYDSDVDSDFSESDDLPLADLIRNFASSSSSSSDDDDDEPAVEPVREWTNRFTAPKIIKMKAVRVKEYGGPDVMVAEGNVMIPTPTETQVLVEVRAAGINPFDTYIRAGKYHRIAPLPYTPGSDGAGIVKEIGAMVTSVKPGDSVYFLFADSGSYAQFCTAEEKFVKPLGSLSFEQGAAIGIPYYTAARSFYHCFNFLGTYSAKRNIGKDKTVLVHGASGAVGLACVQIAKALGMGVFGTAGSERGVLLVKSHGASQVFNHRENGYKDEMQSATENKGFDIIMEMLADKNLATDLDLVAQDGIIVVVGCRGTVEIEPRVCMRKECVVTGVLLPCSTPPEEMHSIVQGGIQAGWLQPHVSKTYTLEEAPQSHIDIINTTSAQGKIVFKL